MNYAVGGMRKSQMKAVFAAASQDKGLRTHKANTPQ